jgi:hypothetical protein
MAHASSASPLLALPAVPLVTPPPGLLGALQALVQLAGRHLPGPLDALARSLLGEVSGAGADREREYTEK